MKYVVVLPDGVSDQPIESLGGKTPLQVAKHPRMDSVAASGKTGWAHTIPSGFKPGSDVGCMSVFGYDPRRYHTGRAPLEAAAQGISLQNREVAFRCNTLTVQDGVMVDHSADHIPTAESAQLIESMRQQHGADGVTYYPGVSYRHIAVVRGEEFAKTECTPPHDILGKPVASFLPRGPGSELLRQHMEQSTRLLAGHEVNRKRAQAGKNPATMLWFWGQGTSVAFPPFDELYHLRAACISAVDIVRGIGKLAKFEILQVPGITGYFDTNYQGKAEYALKALDDGFDLVLVHIESTDEAGHMGSIELKIKAIEDVDRLVVGPLLDGLQQRGGPFGLLITPDHPTSTMLRTHVAEPVPFAMMRPGLRPGLVKAYDEQSVRASKVRIAEGYQLMAELLGQSRASEEG
jgi:2,3-bisphosphoglycerate-independent phosphoglycerate mutase